MSAVYVVYKRAGGNTLVRLRNGKWATWKNSKGFGALQTCVSLHSRAGAERIMKTVVRGDAKGAGYISSSNLSKEESYLARAIKHNRNPF